MEKVVELLIQGFDEVQSGLLNHILWFHDTLPHIQNCFVFLQKHATAARDLLKYYGEDWSGLEVFLKKGEFLQRLTLVTDSAFIFSFSSVEYLLKLIVKNSKSGPLVQWFKQRTEKAKKRKRKPWVSFSSIIEASEEIGLVNASELDSWSSVIGLRNVIMHNNAVVDEETTFRIGELHMKTEAGATVSYPLVKRPKVVKALVSLTRSWIEAYLRLHAV